MAASRSARFLLPGVAAAAVLVAGCSWFEDSGEPRSEVVVGSPAREGWKTVEYHGVQIDVPFAWVRLDMSDCEFQFERWAPSDSPPCDFEGGAAFYGSATFDPARGPGVWRTTTNGTDAWGGYVYAGDWAVYTSDTDRDLVQEVLDSARVTGGKARGVR
jgi:hypothetical protein